MSSVRVLMATMAVGVGVAGAVYTASFTTTNRRVTGWRLTVTGGGVAGLIESGSVYRKQAACLRNGQSTGFTYRCVAAKHLTTKTYPGWDVPVAILIGFAGLGIAAAILVA